MGPLCLAFLLLVARFIISDYWRFHRPRIKGGVASVSKKVGKHREPVAAVETSIAHQDRDLRRNETAMTQSQWKGAWI